MKEKTQECSILEAKLTYNEEKITALEHELKVQAEKYEVSKKALETENIELNNHIKSTDLCQEKLADSIAAMSKEGSENEAQLISIKKENALLLKENEKYLREIDCKNEQNDKIVEKQEKDISQIRKEKDSLFALNEEMKGKIRVYEDQKQPQIDINEIKQILSTQENNKNSNLKNSLDKIEDQYNSQLNSLNIENKNLKDELKQNKDLYQSENVEKVMLQYKFETLESQMNNLVKSNDLSEENRIVETKKLEN